MYEFSQEHLEKLLAQLAFKKAVVEHIHSQLTNTTTEIGGFDSKYIAQLTKAPLLTKLNLDIQELEASIAMLEDYFS